MKIFLFIAIAFVVMSRSFATAQSSDWMIYEGKFFRIADDPLDTFPWLGDKRPRFEIAPGVSSTGNYRGYLALWEIRGGRLFLAGLDSFAEKPESEKRKFDPDDEKTWEWSPSDDKERADLRKIFPSRFKDGRVFADWFTGTIRIPDGKILKYIHFGHASVFERDILLHFEAGVLKKCEMKKNKLPDDDPEAVDGQKKKEPNH